MILSLDCSTLTLSLALLRADRSVIEERQIGPPHRQSEVLPMAIHDLLDAHGHALTDVTAFVVGLGPGSFTGLRIGLATAKGLAYAQQIPITGASSLAALAFGATGEIIAIAVVKRSELYVGHFKDGQALSPETSMTVGALATMLKATPHARVVGPGLADYRKALEDEGVPAAQLLAGPLVPSAAALARIATIPTTYDATALFALEPHYIRGSGAEENPKFPPLPGLEPKARLKED